MHLVLARLRNGSDRKNGKRSKLSFLRPIFALTGEPSVNLEAPMTSDLSEVEAWTRLRILPLPLAPFRPTGPQAPIRELAFAMGSGASAGLADSAPTLPWPDDAKVILRPDGALPEGLKTSGPVPSTENGVPFWRLGGPSKGRLRVLDDAAGLLELKEPFTIALCFRVPGAYMSRDAAKGWDSLLLGHDNKHWLAMPGDDKTKLCCLEGDKCFDLSADFLDQGWIQVFLRSAAGATSVLGVDSAGLIDLGTFDTSLAGSKLRSAGWSSNEVDIAAVAFWDRAVSWEELSMPLEPQPAAPSRQPDAPAPKKICGQVTDLAGAPLKDVSVKWPTGGCISDGDGTFEAVLEDTETHVPEDGSQASASSACSCVSFECDGFAPTSVRASLASEQSVVVALRKLSAATTLDASEGGVVVDPASGSSVSVPAGSLAYADGSPVTGPVTVSLSVIDATDPASLASMPGDFSAVGADGENVMLESLGAAWIGAVDAKGEALQVREDSEGVTLDIHTTARVNATKLGVVPDMWSFDEASGKWQLEASDLEIDGRAAPNATRATAREVTEAEVGREMPRPRKKKSASRRAEERFDPAKVESAWMTAEEFQKLLAEDGQKSLAAPLSKLGYWNIDMAYRSPTHAVMLKGLVLDHAGSPLADAQLWAVGKSYYGRSPDTSDKAGRFESLMVQFDSEVDVEVSYHKFLETDSKLDVFFQGGLIPKVSEGSLKQLLKQLPGCYEGDGKASPTWWKHANSLGPGCSIRWSAERHRWHLMVAEQVLYVRSGDPAGSPIGDGWCPVQKALTEMEVLAPLNCQRRRKVISQKFGPYHTGPAGNFVDLGEFKTGA